MWIRNQINIPELVQSTFVPNGFWVASARRDERKSSESRPGDETVSLYSKVRSRITSNYFSIIGMPT